MSHLQRGHARKTKRAPCAATLIDFCDMLRAAEPIQQAYFKEVEMKHADKNFRWADMLKDARGRSHAEMISTTTAIDALDLTDATATVTGTLASDDGERIHVTQDEQASAMVDMCRHTLDMTKSQLLGLQHDKETDWLQTRIEHSLEACRVEAVQADASYTLKYNGTKFQVGRLIGCPHAVSAC